MRKLAIGILAAAGVALSVPASAQGVWIGAGPVGVGVGVGPGYGGITTAMTTAPVIAATPMMTATPIAVTAASCGKISTAMSARFAVAGKAIEL